MEPRSDRKERRFRIEKLEERIAPMAGAAVTLPTVAHGLEFAGGPGGRAVPQLPDVGASASHS